jgi:hypothetical protein
MFQDLESEARFVLHGQDDAVLPISRP